MCPLTKKSGYATETGWDLFEHPVFFLAYKNLDLFFVVWEH